MPRMVASVRFYTPTNEDRVGMQIGQRITTHTKSFEDSATIADVLAFAKEAWPRGAGTELLERTLTPDGERWYAAVHGNLGLGPGRRV